MTTFEEFWTFMFLKKLLQKEDMKFIFYKLHTFEVNRENFEHETVKTNLLNYLVHINQHM